MLQFTVEGRPRPQGSKRHVGRGIMVESSRHVGAWREWVRMRAAEAMRDAKKTVSELPINLVVSFWFARPKSHYTKKGLRDSAPDYHTSRPDGDKLLRAVLDAMAGIVFKDDSQIYACNVLKAYAESDRADVTIFFHGENE